MDDNRPMRDRVSAGLPETLSTTEGTYQIADPVAGSETSVLCRAVDPSGVRSAAIKIHADSALAAHEAAVLRWLDGAPAPRLLGEQTFGDRKALVIEWLDGLSLADWARGGATARSGAELCSMLGAFARALGVLHERGVLHRDLKPEHVIIESPGVVRFVDFSAAAIFADERAGSGCAASQLTPRVAAPEQLDTTLGREGTWTDIHGFGVILFWLLSGRLPDEAERLPQAGDDDAMRLARACLARRPEDRPRDAATLFGRLADIAPPDVARGEREPFPDTVRIRARQLGIVPEPPARSIAPRTRRSHRWFIFCLVTFVLLGSAGLGAMHYGLPYYDRHYRVDWVVDPAGGGDARSIAEVLERGGDELVITLVPGRHVMPAVVERRITIGPTDGAETAPRIAASGGPCLLLDRSWARIEGIDFEGEDAPDDTACVSVHGGHASLAGANISGASGVAFAAGRGAQVEIDGLTITGAGTDGLLIAGGVEARLAQIVVADAGRIGMNIDGGAELVAKDVTVSGSGAAGLAIGGGASVSLEGAEIARAGGSGIDVADGARLRIDDARVAEAEGAGIGVYDGARLALANSAVSVNALSGIFVDGASGLTLESVEVLGNGEHGVILLSARAGELGGIEIRENKGAGLVLFPEAAVTLGDTTIRDNGDGDLLDARTPSPDPKSSPPAATEVTE